ncbi:MAG: DsrE family protein [Egibacteraceae bacterium]
MNVLLVANGPAYGSESPFNALRLATALAAREDVAVRLFLMGDAVASAVAGQQLPNGFYHLDRMLGGLARKGGQIGACGTCMDARAIAEDQLTDGVHRSTMDELADWTLEADRVVSF